MVSSLGQSTGWTGSLVSKLGGRREDGCSRWSARRGPSAHRVAARCRFGGRRGEEARRRRAGIRAAPGVAGAEMTFVTVAKGWELMVVVSPVPKLPRVEQLADTIVARL